MEPEIKKYCEYCGSEVTRPYYTVLYSVFYSIDGTNSNILRVDRNSKNVYFRDGQSAEYTFEIESDLFSFAPISTEHLLCSEQCEDDFIHKYWSQFVLGQHPIYNYKQMNIFQPIAIPSSRISGEMHNCECCGSQYKKNGRNWIKTPLISTIKEKGSFDRPPNFDKIKYSLILSGFSSKYPHIQGDWFGYEIEIANKCSKEAFFCSYDCAYEVVKNDPFIILVTSVMDKDRLGVIVKETELFNKMTGSPIIHRPSFIKEIPQ